MSRQEIVIPDLGSSDPVDVIEIMVAPGDQVEVDDSLITLESDKATMEIPSSHAGEVESVNVNVGDKVTTGHVIVTLKASGDAPEKAAAVDVPVEAAPVAAAKEAAPAATSEQSIYLPDIGTDQPVDVIEVLVSVGDTIAQDDAIITLEGDKATMDVPAPLGGEIKAIHVNVGDHIATGDLILTVMSSEGAAAPAVETAVPAASAPQAKTPATPAPQATTTTSLPDQSKVHAGPAVRRFARELGVDLNAVDGSGRKNRIVIDDVRAFVKNKLVQGSSGLGVAPLPVIDFSQFGDIETQPLTKIKRITATNMHRSWVTIPHVTQFDEADITDMEAFRKDNKHKAEAEGYKLTPLVFIMKAVVAALKAFPTFNASLDPSGEQLIVKQYYHIGIAADTPNGLVVPVIRDVDQKSLFDLAKELGTVSAKAREKGLMPKEMQGGSFTISSLGGISGTAFTPIVNLPEVAILGVSKAAMKPVYQDNEFIPRLMLPLSLSYDHRVIDGAEAARFTQFLTECLADIRRLLL